MAKTIEKISAPVEGSYEGKPTISIPLASGRPFSFGRDKAAAIVKWYDTIKAWSAKNQPQGSKLDAAAVAAMSAQEKAELAALLGLTA